MWTTVQAQTFQKFIIITILLLGSAVIIFTDSAKAIDIAHGTLTPCCDVTEGDEFTITLSIDTNFETTGFTIRQMTWESELAGLVDVTFEPAWYDTTFNDPGDVSTPGNLTYLMANKLGGVTGNNAAITFTFTALAPGTMHLNIPDTIWSGQQGFVVDLSDTNY